MGTTLTGTTPQDTYDSLIKVTDNGPLSGTAKYLSDGLGNDSVLALSTARVGIGTTTPVSALTVVGTATSGITIQSTAGASNGLKIFNDSTTDTASIFNHYSGSLILGTSNTERVRITAAGNVGIGTSSPTEKLSVAGNVFMGGTNANIYIDNGGVGGASLVVGVAGSTNGFVKTDGNFPILIQPNNTTRVRIDSDGLKFNADTAAANALDDYEEGTFTPTFSGTTATGGTASGNYTKIGRAVYINIRVESVTFSGSTGPAVISGLPFTVASGFHYYNFSCNYQNCVDGSSTGGFFVVNTTQLQFNDPASIVSATFIDGSSREIILSGFYFV